MPTTSNICGILLILVGVVGYVYGLAAGHASPTALIPAAFGVLFVILGVVSQAKEDLRKHLMHAAAMLGLIGFLIPAVRLLMKIGELTMNAAFLSQLAMAAICLIFVILAVKSFIDARRAR